MNTGIQKNSSYTAISVIAVIFFFGYLFIMLMYNDVNIPDIISISDDKKSFFIFGNQYSVNYDFIEGCKKYAKASSDFLNSYVPKSVTYTIKKCADALFSSAQKTVFGIHKLISGFIFNNTI